MCSTAMKAVITDADRSLALPVGHIAPDAPPVLILHGTADTTVDREQSVVQDQLLTAKNIPHQLILVSGMGHSFTLEKWDGNAPPIDLRPIVTGFLSKYLR